MLRVRYQSAESQLQFNYKVKLNDRHFLIGTNQQDMNNSDEL